MKILISQLTRKQFTAKATGKPFTIVKFKDANSGKFCDSFASQWNADWVDGMELDIPDAQIKEEEYNGYKTLKIQPPGGRRGVDLTPIITKVDEVLKNQELIKTALKVMNGKLDKLMGKEQ